MWRSVEEPVSPVLSLLATTIIIFHLLWFSTSSAAPSAELWEYWQRHSAENRTTVDHSPWNELLKTYLVIDHPSGINRFRYADISKDDLHKLASYLEELQKIQPTGLSRPEQKAYWVNLYNALTVQVILDHFPVKSITDIDISPGLFSNGPWGAKLVHIEGEAVSLNDIEHRILRPIFKDNRLHYALNCASLGCPNLRPEAFTATNMEEMLETGAHEYINSPSGAQLIKGKLQVSSIYKWFQDDFGGSETAVINHLRKYSKGSLSETLKTYSKRLRFDYDWSLNQP